MRLAAVIILAVALGCSPPAVGTPVPVGAPAPALLGGFEDDYGNRFTIEPALWTQHPRARYHIVRWRPDRRYLVAQNGAGNPSEPRRWTRIDWVELEGMLPYRWAFCLTVYAAPSAKAAEAAPSADRDTPRTGCNGYPFSRMRPVPDPDKP